MNPGLKELISLSISNLDQIQDRPTRARILREAADLLKATDSDLSEKYSTTAAFIENSEQLQLNLISSSRTTAKH